jgi:hypothetical protein
VKYTGERVAGESGAKKKAVTDVPRKLVTADYCSTLADELAALCSTDLANAATVHELPGYRLLPLQ